MCSSTLKLRLHGDAKSISVTRRWHWGCGILNNKACASRGLSRIHFMSRDVLIVLSGLTRRTNYRPDCWHRNGGRWHGYKWVRMPAPVALLGRSWVDHDWGHWNWKQTKTIMSIENTEQAEEKLIFVWHKCFRVKDSPGLSPKSAARYPWLWGPKDTWEGLSKGGRPSTPKPLVGPFTLRAVGTEDT